MMVGGDVLGDVFSPAWYIDDRFALQPVRFMPQMLRCGIVRDPWSWYAYVYAEALQRNDPQVTESLSVYGRGSTDFRAVLYGMTHPHEIAPADGEVRHTTSLPPQLGVLWTPVESGGWRGFVETGLGLCAYTALYHYGKKTEWQQANYRPDWACDVLLDSEQLELSLSKVLCRDITWNGVSGGVPARPRPSPEVVRALQAYYDEDMRAWVSHADYPLIQIMQYAPWEPADSGDMVPLAIRGNLRKKASE